MPSNSTFINTLLFQHESQIAAAPSPKGAHAAPIVRVPPHNVMASSSLLSTVLLLIFLLPLSSAVTEAETLLTFKSSISNNTALSSWDIKNPPCKGNSAIWVGVLCIQGSVWGLQLENMGFTGTLNVSSLANLPNLRTISFMNNRFDGPIPEIKKIPALKSVFLSRNRLSGEILEDALTGLVWLKKLYLSQNQFSGAIPASLVSLPKLMEARLDGNHFEGLIPMVKTQNLVTFNVSDNALLGPIPAGLSKMSTTMFQGNQGLCGEPLGPCNSPTASIPSPNNSSIVGRVRNTSKHTVRSILIIFILSLVALVAVLAVMFALRRRSPRPESVESPQSNLHKKSGIKEDQSSHGGSSHQSTASRREVPKLSFVRDNREKFELPDLLKASAEILGSGCFGASYKAAPPTGSAMVVKRFKKMNNVGREEFHEHMRRIGRLDHPNLLPLVAYYYRKEEKLLVTNFVRNGSLAVRLHGHQSLGQASLDWPTRLKIVKGVTQGLAYLYKELPSLIAPHGHLKSSNVLLNESYEPLLSDYGLTPVINQESAQELMVAYKSPEYIQNGRVTKKTDVWGLGMLILEILTGKFPANFLKEGQGKNEEDLAMSVSSMIEGGHMEEVFDKEMEMEKSSMGEMVKLLKIGLNCCETVDNRLELKEVVQKIEEVKEKDDHNDITSDEEKKS